jgi:hypothetical protein
MRTRLLVALLFAGCGTYTTYHSAEPLARGKWQGSLAVTPGVFVDQPSTVKTPTLISEVAVRYGVGGETDVGLKLFSIGSELSVRHRVSAGDWQVALLGAGVFARSEESGGATEAILAQLRLGSAITRRTSSRWAFTFGPLVTASRYWFAGGGNAKGVLVGAFGNAQWSFSSSRRWHLIPEISLHGSIVGDVPVDGFVTLLGLAIAHDF